uniref:ATP-dependent RNA helicase n=1 Tax=Rhizophora mucronata TaxID=61149 RepID=A0A2P2NI94_RHIMU
MRLDPNRRALDFGLCG